jgi:TldD protein
MRKSFFVLFALCIFLIPANELLSQDTLMGILDKSMMRIREDYFKKELPPYFIDMRVHDLKTSLIQFSSGILASSHQSHDRIVTIGMRIGSYSKDNTSGTEGSRMNDNRIPVYSEKLPFEDDPLAIDFCLEGCFESAYDQALQQYRTVQKNENRQDQKGSIPAFSIEKPSVYSEEPVPIQPDSASFAEWKKILRNVSETISNETDALTGDIALMVMDERIYFLNSEGTRIVQNRPQCQIQIIIGVRTREGTMVPMTKTYIGRNIAALPSPEKLEIDVRELLHLLQELKNAPLADPYAGPAILSPEAAGVFFHEIFGHRIEGQRLNNAFDSQTFMDKEGKKVINEAITVISDPTKTTYDRTPLFGSYLYDDEGVPARAVTVIEKGILKEFLMSRTPIAGQLTSNGHGRAQLGFAPYSRQSNLFIQSSDGLSETAMRKQLLKECRKQGKPYGYYVKEVFGGFTSTDLLSPQVFNILPTVVYRIYTDGRPDELVRGVSFIGTPLAVFSEIIATGNDYAVFNGFCGAESGNIPVSTISPGLLIKKLEIQKKPESMVVFPALPSPMKLKQPN